MHNHEEKTPPKKSTAKKPSTKEKEITSPYITENPYPTLIVENFGKIEHAEVELAPLTLFVGDNNSGKSYLMNLIWGFTKFDLDIFIGNRDIITTDMYKFFEKYSIIENNVLKECNKCILEQEDFREILDIINNILDNKKDYIVKKILNDSNSTINRLQLHIPKNSLNIKFKTHRYKIDEDIHYYVLTVYINEKEYNYYYNNYDDDDDDKERVLNILEYSFEYIIISIIEHIFIKEDGASFIPSSRTGFLLTYPLINIDSWGRRFNHSLEKEESKMRDIVFLRSVNSFVQDLMKLPQLDNSNNKFRKLRHRRVAKLTDIHQSYVDFIQDNLIHGKVFIDDNDKQIKYKPHNSDIKLSMHTTSGVVTELAPLLLLFQYGVMQNTLFMEEPEMSLHPQLQQQIARLFIKMVNNDKNVFITTHSDTIIQHINNMIKLYNIKERSDDTGFNKTLELLNENTLNYKYDDSDIIDPKKVRMYQFDVQDNNNKTIVSKLSHTKYGFEVPTFNKFIRSMSRQIDTLLDEM